MMRKIFLLFIIFSISLFSRIDFVSAQTTSLSFFPLSIIQGEPVMVQLDGISDISLVKKLTFARKKVNVFMYQGKITAIVGIDLNKKVGSYEFALELTDGNIIKKSIDVGKREKVEVPLGIPEKLGGNTKASQDKLIKTLVAEKASTSGLRTAKKVFWTNKFIPPLKEIFVTDPYGFSRKTGEYSIAHKGVDYRAVDGTEVMAVNRGVVRFTKTLRNYGKTIVVDHGFGLMSFYLHLSKIKVKVGDTVEQGQIIALSGHTGYTQGAHLHFAIRINDIAIDPVKFFELFR